MARPKQCRRISSSPGSRYFKPRGIPLAVLEEVALSFDEYEAVRLADFEGLYQEQAAEKMGVSRQTFGRIVAAAHGKIAEALVKGKALKIEGGALEVASARMFRCRDCRHAWKLPDEMDQPKNCPSCKSNHIRSLDKGRGQHRGCGAQQGRCLRETIKKRNEEEPHEGRICRSSRRGDEEQGV